MAGAASVNRRGLVTQLIAEPVTTVFHLIEHRRNGRMIDGLSLSSGTRFCWLT